MTTKWQKPNRPYPIGVKARKRKEKGTGGAEGKTRDTEREREGRVLGGGTWLGYGRYGECGDVLIARNRGWVESWELESLRAGEVVW